MAEPHPGIEKAGMASFTQGLLMRLPDDTVLRKRMALVSLPLYLAQGAHATGLKVTEMRQW